MKFSPTLEKVKKIAQTGQYKVLPVSCEILSDICTPMEALKVLKNVSTHCYMLESVAEKEKWGRYTFLGFDPKMEITCSNGEMKAGNIHCRRADARKAVPGQAGSGLPPVPKLPRNGAGRPVPFPDRESRYPARLPAGDCRHGKGRGDGCAAYPVPDLRHAVPSRVHYDPGWEDHADELYYDLRNREEKKP